MMTPLFTSSELISKRFCRFGLEGGPSGEEPVVQANQEGQAEQVEPKEKVEKSERVEAGEENRAEELAERAAGSVKKAEERIMRAQEGPYDKESARAVQLKRLQSGGAIENYSPLEPATAALKQETNQEVQKILAA